MQIPLLLFCLYIYSLSGIPAHAQSPGSYTTRGQCIDHCHQYENSLYLQTLKAATRASTWCYYWYRECTCISMDCGSFQIKCQYVGISSDDENCTVRVDADVIPSGALVPGPATSTSSSRARKPSQVKSSSVSSAGYPVVTPISDISLTEISATDNPTASAVSAAGTIILIVGAALGSLFAAKHALLSPSSEKSTVFSASHGYGHSTTNTATVGASEFPASFLFQCASSVDPVSLLLHFQFLSFSGLLSLAYPLNYLGFTFNFAWANFLFPSAPFEEAANRMNSNSCWKPGNDQPSPGGFETLAAYYGIPLQDLAGIAYICVITGIGIALAFFTLVGAILFALERITRNSKKHKAIERFQGRWPAISSNTTLRLFIWVLGTISAFTFLQFTHTCGGASLSLAIIEFVVILATLILVSIFIMRVARGANGLDALFTQDEDSKYARRWGALYIKLKRETYWFFIPQYCWVVIRSAIISFAQDRGLIQICLLIGLEIAKFSLLAFKRPYGTAGGNVIHITESGYHLVSKILLSTFLTEVTVGNEAKHALGIVLMSLGIAYSAVLFLLLVIKAGAAFAEWRIRRREKSDSDAVLQPYEPAMLGHPLYH